MSAVERRTKRRYAHEIYPHGDEWETRPLSVEVPYWYARMAGLDVGGTGWTEVEPRTAAGDRITEFLTVAHVALLADALQQGMTGDEAWAWADQRVTDDMEVAWERAVAAGVPLDRIKPYPCGPEPTHHAHYTAPDARGLRYSTRIAGRESECEDCTEPVEVSA